MFSEAQSTDPSPTVIMTKGNYRNNNTLRAKMLLILIIIAVVIVVYGILTREKTTVVEYSYANYTVEDIQGSKQIATEQSNQSDALTTESNAENNETTGPNPEQVAVDPVPHPGRNPDALVTVKISRYDPTLGGTNCFRWVNGYCQSPMANGERWEDKFGWAAACSPEWPFGTIFEIGDRRWSCKDRGGKIKQVRANVYWVDMLSHIAEYPYGHETIASVWFPQ